MVTSISSSSNSDYIQQLMAQMMKNMSAADTDGTTGLSKTEISSINTGDDKGGAGFLKALSDNFDKIDSDSNGQLTQSEIQASKPQQPMGPPPGMSIEDLTTSANTDGTDGLSKDELASVDSSSDAGQANFIKNLQDNFDKIDTNKDGELSADEIKAAKPQHSHHANESKTTSTDDTTTATATTTTDATSTTSTDSSNSSLADFESSFSKASDYLMNQLVNAYKAGSASLMSNLESSLNLAV